ncbi:MAG: hypothetical protein AB1716_13955 [Planctomycetota bacterium]
MFRLPTSLLTLFVAVVAAAQSPAQNASRGRAVFVVDNSVYPQIKDKLERYAQHVRRERGVLCFAMPDDYYSMQPPAIRAKLKAQHEKDGPPLVGAIMVGAIPHALKGDPKEILIPQPLFYEDFDARWEDRNGDGIYQNEEITNDRRTNPTEIWTSWWVPPCPADDTAAQVKLLNTWLDKLDRYYKGELIGRDAMLWITGNVGHVETCEAWTVLLKDTMNPGPPDYPDAKPLNQRLQIWCRIAQDEGAFRPNKRQEEFLARDLVSAFTLQPWQHAHFITHGDPCGWYWDGTGVVTADPPKAKSRTTLKLDFAKLAAEAGGPIGANIVTTSGCSNGNFRGDYIGPAYERFIGGALLFSPDTLTVAYYGAASPQSTGGDAGFCTQIVESLRADGDSYLAEGYRKMRNMDFAWGTQHYFFRGGDEKILSGDPFAKYRPSPPPSPEQQQRVAEKVKAAAWTVVGPG